MNANLPDQTPDGRTRTSSTGSLGEVLRRARESHNITLRSIAEQTRISLRHLEAIEADDYKQLPGGIFNRSFIKSFARQIGFNEEEALQAYARTVQERGGDVLNEPGMPHRPRVYTDDNNYGARSPFTTALLSIVVLAILSLGLYAGFHWYQRRAGGDTNRGEPSQGDTKGAPVNGAAAPVRSSSSSSDQATLAATPIATAAAPLPASFNVRVTAAKNEPVWIKARTDEEEAKEWTLPSGESKEFVAQDRLTIQYSKSKANALTVTINGRLAKVPAESQTRLAELVVTREGYEQLLQ